MRNLALVHLFFLAACSSGSAGVDAAARDAATADLPPAEVRPDKARSDRSAGRDGTPADSARDRARDRGASEAATADASKPSTRPSCTPPLAICGPKGNEDCCAVSIIPGGNFNRSNDSKAPATVSDFKLDIYEVTVGRFRRFVDAGLGTQSNPPPTGSGAHPKIPDSGWQASWNTILESDTAQLKLVLSSTLATYSKTSPAANILPMNYATWFEAFAFCAWDGGRLPTEAEWNYAAAGGAQQRIYPWSSPPQSLVIDSSYAKYGCWTVGCGTKDIVAVGSFSPKGDGRWGQRDLAGNVSEFVLDQFVLNKPYITPCIDCGDHSTYGFVFRGSRGGSYNDDAAGVTTAMRRDLSATYRDTRQGFRCVRN